MPVGKQLAMVGSRSTRPFVIAGWPGSSFLLAFHFASAQGWNEGPSFPLKVGPGSEMLAQTPFKSGVELMAPTFFVPVSGAVWANNTGDKANARNVARTKLMHRFRTMKLLGTETNHFFVIP